MSGGRGLREFLHRWSQRKRDHGAALAAPRSAPVRPARAVSLAGIDLDRLDFSSDYTPFLNAGIPEEVASRALRKLWSSSDIIARPDELDDYLEDFTEAAMALSPEAARSAYRIGRGLVGDENVPGRGADCSDAGEPARQSEDFCNGKVTHSVETN